MGQEGGLYLHGGDALLLHGGGLHDHLETGERVGDDDVDGAHDRRRDQVGPGKEVEARTVGGAARRSRGGRRRTLAARRSGRVGLCAKERARVVAIRRRPFPLDSQADSQAGGRGGGVRTGAGFDGGRGRTRSGPAYRWCQSTPGRISATSADRPARGWRSPWSGPSEGLCHGREARSSARHRVGVGGVGCGRETGGREKKARCR